MSKKIFIVAILAAGFLGFKGKDAFKTLGLKFAAPTVYGKGNVTNPEPGEIVYDSSDNMFWGYDTSNNWVQLTNGVVNVPIGTILPFGGAVNPPTGYKFCNGEELNVSDYQELHTIIGNSFGTSGAGKFNIPDLRGRFLRGVNGGATGQGRDPDATTARGAINPGGATGDNVGSLQLHQLQSHNHSFTVGLSGGGTVPANGAGSYVSNTTSSVGGNETRPSNVYVNYIIKVK